ncbi:MAG: SUMF1/EgtB/PvdO family nonheme iron enzyme [Chitinophagaceae bacterium]|nr:SUMF1/EgtB/PvdO family nonheme iron enzyme [Anaerolineae bacterium]
MRLFISYARVDKPYSLQIVNLLDIHEVWYDQRIYAGQQWWKEILRRLDWCEGFVYLMSPDSIASEYCRKEFELAQELGRHIFPVLILKIPEIPTELNDVQCADLSRGLTPETVKQLLNAIYLAERQKPPVSNVTSEIIPPELQNIEIMDSGKAVSMAAQAMGNAQYDRAVFLLKQAKARGYKSRFINIEALLNEAEIALERQMVMRESERDYRQIAELIQFKNTQRLGCEAFEAYQKVYPNYDPDGLAGLCAQTMSLTETREIKVLQTGFGSKPTPARPASISLPLLEWCEIPGGAVKTDQKQDENKPVYVDAFAISKYPITNVQYQLFLDDPLGYTNPKWWEYSSLACDWLNANPESRPSSYKGAERPREMVNWFEAVAFCNWLSGQLGLKIRLPTLFQRQRAVQGDDDRLFPWGDTFEAKRCNTRESEIKMTTDVTRYPDGISPYGVYDLAGNVWEWCLSTRENSSSLNISANEKCVVQGGSFVSPYPRSQVTFSYQLAPQTMYASIGLRIVQM